MFSNVKSEWVKLRGGWQSTLLEIGSSSCSFAKSAVVRATDPRSSDKILNGTPGTKEQVDQIAKLLTKKIALNKKKYAQLLDNTAFKNFLELTPELREVIKDFYDSRYTTCLAAMERLRESFLLDIHLHKHVQTLYDQIRQRALKQYVSPFLSVNLAKMATAFNTTVPVLEKELAQMIMDGEIQARIDSHNKVLYARRDNERVVTYEKAIGAGHNFVAETEANIRQLSMLRNGFELRPPRTLTGTSSLLSGIALGLGMPSGPSGFGLHHALNYPSSGF
eukprot:RCo033809